MAHVKKCDLCGTMDDSVKTYHNRIFMLTEEDRKSGALVKLEICLPGFKGISYETKELCHPCLSELIRQCMPALFGLLKPFQPQRVPGFVQGVVVEETAPELSNAEARQMLARLSRKLLKA